MTAQQRQVLNGVKSCGWQMEALCTQRETGGESQRQGLPGS